MSNYLKLFGITWLLSCSILFSFTLIVAYLSGAEYVVLELNNYGEQTLEFFLAVVFLPAGLLIIAKELKEWWNE